MLTDLFLNRSLLKVLYPNTSPYLPVTHSSLEKLSSRLNEKILMNRFRAHIIVTGDDNSRNVKQNTFINEVSAHEWINTRFFSLIKIIASELECG